MTFTCPKCGAGIELSGPLPFTGPCKYCGVVSTWENPRQESASLRSPSAPSPLPTAVKAAGIGTAMFGIVAILIFVGAGIVLFRASGGPLSSECWFCKGTGTMDCGSCEKGVKDCIACVGGRTADGGRCGFCNGRGSEPCTFCDAKGAKPCMSCGGSGKKK